MISIDELNEVKEKRKTSLYYEEKEYLQYIFLNAASKYPDELVFKGGTCLRICYGLERASEDLDFSASVGLAELKKIVGSCLKDFTLLNIPHRIYLEKNHRGNLRIEARFEGPLFNGNPNSTNTLKTDFNKGTVMHKEACVVRKLFSDVPLFTLAVMAEKEILAEKVRSLAARGEPRDMYDVWVLISKAEVDMALIQQKLAEEGASLSGLALPSKRRYETELRGLLHYLPPYEQVKKEVETFLEGFGI